MWGNLVTWQSKKQKEIVKVELKVMAQDIREGIWSRRILRELRISIKKPMKKF